MSSLRVKSVNRSVKSWNKMSSEERKMGFGAKCMWLLAKSVAIMPHWVKYGIFGRFVYFVLAYVVRYRRKLILKQLSDSFPEKSRQEIASICKEYYRTLAETVVGTMSISTMDYNRRREVLKVEVPQHILDLVRDKDFVYLSSHHNLWEYAQFAGLSFPNHLTLCAYHPLTDRAWDEFYYRLRRSEQAEPIASGMLIRYFLQHRKQGINGKRLLLGLIADQNAAPQGDVHWYDFLNHKTLFFEGGEHLALKFGMPVLYLSMSRLSEGMYKGEVKLLYDGVESVERHQVTQRYVEALEQDIRREPSRWMWSHRRWKYYPDPVTGEAVYRRE